MLGLGVDNMLFNKGNIFVYFVMAVTITKWIYSFCIKRIKSNSMTRINENVSFLINGASSSAINNNCKL